MSNVISKAMPTPASQPQKPAPTSEPVAEAVQADAMDTSSRRKKAASMRSRRGGYRSLLSPARSGDTSDSLSGL